MMQNFASITTKLRIAKKKAVLIAAGIFLSFFIFLFFIFLDGLFYMKIIGNSMYPTLENGERVKYSVSFSEIERFDIVFIRKDGETLVKRVIGLPGEEIRIEEGKVFIDGEKLTEEYTIGKTTEREENFWVLGDDEYFLLGDNREDSFDSRDFGKVKRKEIFAKMS